MELRSRRVLKKGKADTNLSFKNLNSPVIKGLSLRSGKIISAAKEANEAEIGVCVDNADENLEMSWTNGSKNETSEGIKDGSNTDDKGLFLGSEVLDPIKDLPVSCSGEIEEESVERIQVEEGNKALTNYTNHDLKVCENEFERVESGSFADDTTIVNGEGGMDEIRQEMGRGQLQKTMRKMGDLNKNGGVIGDGGEGDLVVVKQKRGRKRKNMKGSKCKRAKKEKSEGGGVQVSERVQQLSTTTVSGAVRVVDGGSCRFVDNGGSHRLVVLGLKRMIIDESTQPKKKLKRGRPPKLQRKNTQPIVMPKKKLKRPGRGRRPSKVEGKTVFSHEKKKRGRPRKKHGKETVSQEIQKKRYKDMMLKKLKMRKRKLTSTKSPKTEEENSEGKEKRKCILRDKLVDILLKAGWMINRRERQEKTYKDKIYVEPSGRSHWSITRAYAKLTKKVKDGDADSNEVSAFIPIPDEEMRMLFRYVDKELGYKKKKKKKGKDGIFTKKMIRVTTEKKKKLKNGKNRKPRLLARGLEKGSKKKLVIKKRNLLSWMIDSGVITPGLKVQYGKTRQQKKSFEGTITTDGIVCSCCKGIMGISEFVGHAGGKHVQAFDNVYLESGISLRKCLLDSWRKEEESNIIKFNIVDVKEDDPNDDTCTICGDGGNLICCDGCPSTFHESCLDIQNFPPGDWNCFFCKCKFCRVVSVSAPQTEDSHNQEMHSCCLCEEKFHQSCLEEDMDSNKPFCGRKCKELFERLQTYLGVKHELEDGFSWTLLQRSDINQDLTFQETQMKVESNSKLAVAFSVMDECFLPIVDDRSGTSIIHNVVYNCGSNFKRLNCSGFLTAVLEKGDELITAASIRIHGYRLAEMPFIGTRHVYRRQGMCRRLLDAIESTLSSIGVEELLIPAIPALLQTWTKVFGFMPLEESKKQAIKSINMMVFPGIDVLQKPLLHINPNPFPENAVGYEKTEDKSTVSDGLCDLNFPVKNAICGIPTTKGEKFPECSMELESRVENDDVLGVEGSPLTSELVPKNTFDLNLHPTGFDDTSIG